ncbi:hypothetical protein HYX14_02255 [Candidatus Woesearchaeota archaeon]|nr:hypothetical protein [Candidatus Woesearchaeota archaeon]
MKNWIITHKYQILMVVLMLAVLVIAGCGTTGGYSAPPPSGPIGGGCG